MAVLPCVIRVVGKILLRSILRARIVECRPSSECSVDLLTCWAWKELFSFLFEGVYMIYRE